ncbi:helix-turn-helix transcriptional regulator [Streptomyces sp. CAU 1734]|uniref:helix-turn-helix domain-containing protein n=1 Tax=Streptomyces sp. CAU 1734 TaxID=3140360 RepID=UPI00326024A5
MYSKKQRKNTSAMRLVGRQMARLRNVASLTQQELATALGTHLETVASIEQGRRVLKLDYAQMLDEILQSKGVLEVAVDNMPEVDMIPAWADHYMAVEREAIALSFYENHVLPGLLQTPDYARALFRNRVPATSEEEIEANAAARMARQEILHRKNPTALSFIFSEAVLMDRLGGDEVYREMLSHVRSCADLPGVNIQIMPFGRHGHAGLDGPFVVLETADHQHLAYTETQRGSQLIGDQDEVSILTRKYAMLRTQALNPEETKALLDRLLGDQ